ncbi:putative disease resistance protein RGA4 [Mercurialis annua]|uniref:putative disease resistance protein RGA4 n=1 Tax=Mercurialis annua TaxID=3986 RepID=UPI0024AD1081|nr:putative disease resistance protein RGA4 [Mercurialis annua]
MAEAVPFGVATEILYKLGSSLFQEIGSFYGVKQDLHKLENTLSTIKAALLDAEERQERSHLVQDWIRKLKDAVFDADDLLDSAATRVSQSPVSDLLLSPNLVAFRFKMGRKIKEIRRRLDGIADDMAKFNFRDRDLQFGNREREQTQTQTHSFVLNSEVIGRNESKEEIVGLLVQENCSNSIISVVGIGGLGKTTLAQFVYNDETVVSFFEKRIWVCVTQDFDVEMVVRKILASITMSELGSWDMDQLQLRLRENLNDKLYLIVLDDMWNENLEKWMRLKNLLVGGANGSKILVTTRSRKVASVMGAEFTFLLKGLTEEESWILFKKIAFRGREGNVDENLEGIGKRLLDRCKGVPLAIRTLGSVMQFKREESDWLAIENSEIWKLSQESSDILPALKMSYDQLPINLRQCFAYCSIFPKGCIICKDQLIQLWMAQGYITSSSGNHNLEEIGDQYFNDFLLRSFFQEAEKDVFDNIISCKMHDLIHDLAQTVAGTDCSLLGIDAETFSKRLRHLSFGRSLYYTWEVPRHLQQVKGLRTFLLPVNDRCINESNQAAIISNFRRLRVLDMHCLGIENLPCSIGKLQHLRYLDISVNNLIETLPDSVCNLHYLQTLLLSRCERLVELPRAIRKLINLRHLVIIKCPRLHHMPPGLGELTFLRTLSRFIVPRDEIAGPSRAQINELNGLNLLRNGIWLKNLECAVVSESKEANLKGKIYLQFLGLHWNPSKTDNSTDESVLENLQPHPNLKHLWLEGYAGVKISSWLASLRNIVRITIRDCPNCKYLPALEHLPFLKFLQLHKLAALEYVEYGITTATSSSAPTKAFFPSLQELWLYGLPNFKGWQSKNLFNETDSSEASLSVGHDQYLQRFFPFLTQLTIERCSKLNSMLFFPHLESLHLINSSIMVAEASLFSELPHSLSPFSTIQFLCIDKCEDLLCLPERGLQNLTSLKTLQLKNCPRLTFLSPGINCLTQLSSLEIINCSMLDLFDDELIQWQELKSMCRLVFDFLPRLFYLPDGLQNVTSLQELRISNCYNLVALPEWLMNFSSLQEVQISDCTSLKPLPEEMSKFVTLKKLKIPSGPRASLVHGNCQKNTGKDLPRIVCISESNEEQQNINNL